MRNSKSLSIFKKCILKFIRPSPSSTHNCFNTKGIKYLTKLSLGFSHLREHKFKHGALDSFNPNCNCGLNIETTCHFLLHCPSFINERTLLLNDVSRIPKDALPTCETAFVKLRWRFIWLSDKHFNIKCIIIIIPRYTHFKYLVILILFFCVNCML